MLDDSKNKLVALILQRGTDGLLELPEIKPHIYMKLAQEIVKRFPTEAEGVYYVPRIRNTKLQDGIPPQGKLRHHYTYVRRVHAAKRKLITQQINVEQTRVIPDLDDANEKIQFLYKGIHMRAEK
ncbi:uncharacterized protein [Chelonus insularis]|uniref:uncharacterized protein n=1 Tax=Chelonus insularis TaxID=460826 RepID=UPI00158DD458|nr:uncharacterized protein LOC118067079 [Chelonus insularis]